MPVRTSYIFTSLVVAAFVLAGCVEESALRVERVVDGDTFVLSGDRTVRLIGVDAPEKYLSDKLYRDARRSGRDVEVIQALGRKASDYAEQLIGGRLVELAFDPVNEADDHRDTYGRLLAYVWVLDDDGRRLFRLNDRLVGDGFAYAYTRFPFRYQDRFLSLQREARRGERGLWTEGLWGGASGTASVVRRRFAAVQAAAYRALILCGRRCKDLSAAAPEGPNTRLPGC